MERAQKNITKKKNSIVINSASGELIILFCDTESDCVSWIMDIEQCSTEPEDEGNYIFILYI